MLTTILAAAVVLGVLIFVHELGHFWAAKAVGIDVPRFSIGIGPKLTGFRWGETEYVISWLPLGGYVKMAGMGEEEALEGLEGEAEPDREPSDGDFESKPLWARFLAISAGVIMNFLFAAVAFGAIAAVWGVQGTQEPVIGGVQENGLPPEALELARVPEGTRVERVDGNRVSDFEDLRLALASVPAGEVTLSLEGGREVTFTMPEGDSARARVVRSVSPVIRMEPRVGDVVEGGPADSAGLRAGDVVREVAGEPISSFQEFASRLEERPGRPVEVTVERDGQLRTLTMVPEERILASGGDTLRYGRVLLAGSQAAAMAAASEQMESPGPVGALAHGFGETWRWTVRTVDVLGRLVTGNVDPGTLGGPVRIAQMSGDVARIGGQAFLNFMAIISINLAILNLLPIPVLDGGWLLFLTVEAVRGQKLSVETRVRLTQAGILVVAAIMIWAIGNDLVHVFGG